MESSTSNRRGNERKRKIDEIHEDLKYDLAFNHLESSKKFRGAASKYLSHADRSEFKEPSDIIERLEATGKLAPGQYGVLRQIGERIQESAFVAAIDEAERKIVKTEVDEDDNQLFHPSNEKINNIIAQTKREIDQHICDKSYVRLPMVDHGLKILQQYGLLFLVGPSGCGKTKCALQILSEAKQVRVLKLQSLHEWSEMVEVAVANWVWYDDVFEHECVAKNRSKIATIKACVQDGYSKVIFTITDEIFKQNEGSFQNKIPTAAIINFEESPYTLCVEMKHKILMLHLRVNDVTIKAMKRPSFIMNNYTEDKKEIYESDIQEIILKKPLLGFPQVCKVFCNHLPFLRKGHHFFDNPSVELLNAMTALSSTDIYQFLTLVFTFKNNGTIDLKNIDELKVKDLLQTISVNIPRDIEACIRVAIDNMKGKYLIPMPMNVFHFSHSSIYRAVAISYARLSNRTKIDAILSLNIANINELVKPSGYDEIDFCVIEAGRELYEELADIMSQKLKDHDLSLFKCDLFAIEDFIDIFIPKYQIPKDQVDEHLIYFFKNGRIGLAKKILNAKCLTIDGLEDRTFSKILKESSVHNQLHVVKFLVNEKPSCPQKTIAIIECMDYSSQTDAVSAILVQSLAYAALNQEQLMAVSRVLARDECWKNFVYFINNLPDANNDQTIEAIGTTIGRRNARKCLDVVLNKFRSKQEEIALYIIEGACTGGHNDFITWGTEYYPELMKTNAARLLKLVEIPTTLEILLESYSYCLSAKIYSDALYELCTKGKSLCAKVLIDRWSDSSDSDIENALRAALLGKHFGTVNIIMESFSIPHDMITEIIGSMRGSGDMRPHSAYPKASTPRPPSVLSRDIFSPCRYEESQKRHNRKLCVMRCLSKQYLTTESNIYSRAYRLSSLIHDNDMPHENKLQQCQALLAETPNIYEDLIIEPAVYSCCTEEMLFMFLVKYPNIWKQIFSSCRSDTKRFQCLIVNLQKIFKKTGREFLPTMFDFLVQTNDDILAFMTALTATGCIFDIEEFILALERIMEPHQEIAEILLQNIEELTLHNTTIVPLKLACKRNQISVFKFIWMHTENQIDIISDFLSKDIVDQNSEVIEIMLSDLPSADDISQIFVKCLQYRSSRWLSTLSRTHHQVLLDSIDQIASTIHQNGDTTSLDLMLKHLKLGQRDVICILMNACEKGWKIVIKEVLKMEIKLTGSTIVKSIEKLCKFGHHDMLVCFIEVLENRRLTHLQRRTILDTIMTCRERSSGVTGMLQRLVLIPNYAPYVFSHKVISVIGIDFFITSLSVFLSNISAFHPFKFDCHFDNLVSSLTVHQENQIVEIILGSSLTDSCFKVLAAFLPNCRNVEPEHVRILIDKVFPEEGNHVATHSNSILLYILENCSSLLQNEVLLKNIMEVIRNKSVDTKVKTSAFELTRKRKIDIFHSIRQYFHELCQVEGNYDWKCNREKFFQHLIDADYLDRIQRIEGIKLCILGDKVKNQTLARMILRKDKASLPIDKIDVFKKICKCNDVDVQLVEDVLELYSNDIDDFSLEVGLNSLLKSDSGSYITSKMIVDTLVGRRVSIGCNASYLFNKICHSYENNSLVKLLKYIIERYTDRIEVDVIDAFNDVIVKLHCSVALELCKAFPERISCVSSSEKILYLFLDPWPSDEHTELLIKLSTILHIDREMCIKLAQQEIPQKERWKAVCSMLGGSFSADMKWKLLCLWLAKCGIKPYWLSEADIELTHEQVKYLKGGKRHPHFLVKQVLKVCKVK